jgi:predicted CXXCH cytochrome family protein
LTCHDGTLAVGAVLNYQQGGAVDLNVTGGNVTAGLLVGTKKLDTSSEFAKNHPLGVQKPADSTGFTSFKTVGTSSAVNYRNPLGSAAGYVACASCHNPHITTNSPYLRISNSASAICTTCHNL